MKKFSIALIALAAAVAIAPAAKADTLSYAFVGSGLDVKINFTYNPANDQITSVTGTVYSAGVDITSPTAITALVPDSSSPTPIVVGDSEFDNLISPTSPLILDFYGVLFDAGGVDINIFTNNGGYQWLDSETYPDSNNLSEPLAGYATPEPGTLVLLGTGLLGLAFVAFRKARPSSKLIVQA